MYRAWISRCTDEGFWTTAAGGKEPQRGSCNGCERRKLPVTSCLSSFLRAVCLCYTLFLQEDKRELRRKQNDILLDKRFFCCTVAVRKSLSSVQKVLKCRGALMTKVCVCFFFLTLPRKRVDLSRAYRKYEI